MNPGVLTLQVATPLQLVVYEALVRGGGRSTVRGLVERGLLPGRESLVGYGVALSGLAELGLVVGFRPSCYRGEGTTWEITA